MKKQEKDNSVKMSNVNAGQPFKISFKNLKKAHHTCDIEGKDSENCKREIKNLGIEWIDD